MKTTKWEQTVNEMADQLSLKVADMEPAAKGILGLLKASIELAHLGDDPKEFLKNIKPYLDILLPESDEGLLQNIFNAYPEEVQEPKWIAEYPDELNETFPKLLFLWGLANIIPLGSNQFKSWAYVDKVKEYLTIEHDFLSIFYGWITGSADQEPIENVKIYLDSFSKMNKTCSKFVEILKPKAGTENLNVDFIGIREEVQKKLDEVNNYLVPFNLKNSVSLKNLKNYFANDSFRLAVMGEFKRGKSTLINAIIGVPGLMPAATLPCTSALTEIKYGDNLLYEVNNDGPFGDFKPSTEKEFRDKAGAAAKSKTAKADAEKEAERVPQWRVHISSDFLKGSFVSLIDSPGIGEDHARNRISQIEAERADAAIIVFGADQLASTDELDLIEMMKSKASNLIIAINKADSVSESEWDELKDHAIERISDVTDRISEENIVFISAKNAEDAIKNSISGDPWLARLDNMKKIIQNHLIKNAVPIKFKVLKGKVDDFVKECQEKVDGHCRVKEKDFEEIQGLEQNKKDAQKSYELANGSVESGKKILEDSKGAANKFIEFFWDNLPKILKKTEEKKSEWTSEHSLASPKKHVEEVAKKAQKELLTNFENWVREEGGRFIAELADQKYQEAESKLALLKEYLKNTTGVEDTQINEIKKQVFIDTFGDIDFGMSGRIVGGLAVAGVVAAVIGYAIADIILYYLLSLIAGFLNPFLIAAAVVAALVGFFTVGKAGIKSLVRNKVFSKIKEELESEKNKDKIDKGLKEAISGMFKKMAFSFKENASEVLNEARIQHELRKREMEKFIASKGVSPEAIKEEVAKMKADTKNAKKVLGELAKCVEHTECVKPDDSNVPLN